MIRRFCSNGNLQYALATRRSKIILAALFLVPSVLLILKGVTYGLTATVAQSDTIRTVRRALEIEPHSPDLHHRLGMLRFYNLRGADAEEGLDYLRQAVALAPNRAFYWSDLASACEALQDVRCADSALQRALSLSPMTPSIHWQTANYEARLGRTSAAEEQLRQILTLAPSYAAPTFELCLALHLDSQTVMNAVVPRRKPQSLMLAYAERLAANRDFDAAGQIWDEASRGKTPIPFRHAESYLTTLIKAQQYDLAWEAWRDLEARGGVATARTVSSGNLVFNGGFEDSPLDGGFDWTYGQEAYLSLDFSARGAYRGSRCLQLDFTVRRNDDYEPVYQFIAVTPNSRYVLEGYARSSGITSDSGPRLRVTDPIDLRRLDLATDTTVGTTPWHPIRLTFSTGPGTSFIRLSVWRPRSRSFPTEISGAFWLDDVSLRQVASGHA